MLGIDFSDFGNAIVEGCISRVNLRRRFQFLASCEALGGDNGISTFHLKYHQTRYYTSYK
ncbi:hypothetical protein CaCOL14_012333 [Colletotrichum acutatum]|uniref:Uncharacterized protein n=1 Tax=Glomerella acutata TaxID=27357 RepID=A0AAD8X9G8_GLOAC|nr:uncharacterized protein BDZ83DRAFT_639758 [Colletotrichum acutatum]KAK1711229.1 hypothetical protein BDZ83DRAFT_639758 [Colletotrichum acutatum]